MDIHIHIAPVVVGAAESIVYGIIGGLATLGVFVWWVHRR